MSIFDDEEIEDEVKILLGMDIIGGHKVAFSAASAGPGGLTDPGTRKTEDYIEAGNALKSWAENEKMSVEEEGLLMECAVVHSVIGEIAKFATEVIDPMDNEFYGLGGCVYDLGGDECPIPEYILARCKEVRELNFAAENEEYTNGLLDILADVKHEVLEFFNISKSSDDGACALGVKEALGYIEGMEEILNQFKAYMPRIQTLKASLDESRRKAVKTFKDLRAKGR